MAYYIDLNPVRAGLGHLHGGDWRKAHAAHRTGIFGTGTAPRRTGATIDPAKFDEVLRQKGRLPMTDVLSCRVRYFTDAAVLGSQAFVETHLAAYRHRHGVRERTAPRGLAPFTDWGGLMALRGLRKQPFG